MSDHARLDQLCPYCGAEYDCVAAADGGDPMPKSGDAALCFSCGVFSVYDEDLKLRRPNVDEAMGLAMNTEALLAKQAWMHVMGGGHE